MPKEYFIKGFFKSRDHKKLYLTLLNEDVDPITKKILYSFYSSAQINPINGDEFYVKYDRKSIFCLDKTGTHFVLPDTLLNMQVALRVCLKHYNFTNQQGKKIVGWNIHLNTMNKL